MSRLNIFFEDDPDDNGLDATGLSDDAQMSFDQLLEPYQDEDDELVLPARRSSSLEADATFAKAMSALGPSVVFADSDIVIVPPPQYDAAEDSPVSKESGATGFSDTTKDVEANAVQAGAAMVPDVEANAVQAGAAMVPDVEANAVQAGAAMVPDVAIESALVQVQETVLKVEAQLAQVQQSVMKVEAQLTHEPPQPPAHTADAAPQAAADVVFPISPAPPRIILLPDTAAKVDESASAMPPIAIAPVAPVVVDTPAEVEDGAEPGIAVAEVEDGAEPGTAAEVAADAAGAAGADASVGQLPDSTATTAAAAGAVAAVGTGAVPAVGTEPTGSALPKTAVVPIVHPLVETTVVQIAGLTTDATATPAADAMAGLAASAAAEAAAEAAALAEDIQSVTAATAAVTAAVTETAATVPVQAAVPELVIQTTKASAVELTIELPPAPAAVAVGAVVEPEVKPEVEPEVKPEVASKPEAVALEHGAEPGIVLSVAAAEATTIVEVIAAAEPVSRLDPAVEKEPAAEPLVVDIEPAVVEQDAAAEVDAVEAAVAAEKDSGAAESVAAAPAAAGAGAVEVAAVEAKAEAAADAGVAESVAAEPAAAVAVEVGTAAEPAVEAGAATTPAITEEAEPATAAAAADEVAAAVAATVNAAVDAAMAEAGAATVGAAGGPAVEVQTDRIELAVLDLDIDEQGLSDDGNAKARRSGKKLEKPHILQRFKKQPKDEGGSDKRHVRGKDSSQGIAAQPAATTGDGPQRAKAQKDSAPAGGTQRAKARTAASPKDKPRQAEPKRRERPTARRVERGEARPPVRPFAIDIDDASLRAGAKPAASHGSRSRAAGSSRQRATARTSVPAAAQSKAKSRAKHMSGSEKKSGYRRVLFVALRDVAIAMGLMFILLQFFSPTVVTEHSMENTLVNRDILYISRQAYLFDEPQHGDIVVFQTELVDSGSGQRKTLVKRVIGMPGDKVYIRGGEVFLNDSALDEPYVKSGTTAGLMNEITVPDGCYFVLGDNREISNDSRYPDVGSQRIETSSGTVSLVTKDQLRGKVILRIFPMDKIGLL